MNNLRKAIKLIQKEYDEIKGCGKRFTKPEYRKYIDCTCGDFGWYFCEKCRWKVEKKQALSRIIGKLDAVSLEGGKQ